MIPRILLSFGLVTSFLLPARAQQPRSSPEPQKPATAQQTTSPEVDSQDVVRITTNLVQVDAVVTKNEKVVSDLLPEDFEIFEDGKPQTITNFSYVSNLPSGAAPTAPAKSADKTAPPIPPAKINLNDQRRIVALVIDDLGISWESMAQIRAQVRKFIDQASPNDLIAIIRTGGDVGSLQQFTNDKRVLQSAWDHLRWNPCSRAGIHVFEPAGSIQGSNRGLCSEQVTYGTLKALSFIVQGMRYLPGRKSIVLFSDYLPIQDQQPSVYDETRQPLDGSQSNSDDQSIPDSGISYYSQLQRIAEIAIRTSVVIYGVDTRGLQTTGLTAADQITFQSRQGNPNDALRSIINQRSAQLLRGREGSELIAKQTGGFLVRDSNDFGLKEIMKDQQGYYLIGFRPAEETFNRNFHHIKIKLKRGGLTVRTRAGFYGFTDDEARPKQLSVSDEVNKALISPFGVQDITLRLTSFFVDDPQQGPVVRSFLYLDPHDLSFTEADGWHSTNLDITSVVFGDNGRIVSKEDRNGRLRFRGNGYERASREGITYSFDVPVKRRGAFQFRVAVRDANTAKIGSAGQFLEVPNLRKGELALSGIVARAMAPETAGDAQTVATGPAVRQFRQGSTISLAYEIYNASSQGQPARLSSQLRIIRDGKIVFTGNIPLTFGGQTDLQRLTSALKLELSSQFPPGNYVAQIIVTDANQQERVTSQWIDFEIVK